LSDEQVEYQSRDRLSFTRFKVPFRHHPWHLDSGNPCRNDAVGV